MFGLAFCICLVILLSILTSKSLHKGTLGELIINVIFLFMIIYTTLTTIKSVF